MGKELPFSPLILDNYPPKLVGKVLGPRVESSVKIGGPPTYGVDRTRRTLRAAVCRTASLFLGSSAEARHRAHPVPRHRQTGRGNRRELSLPQLPRFRDRRCFVR